MWPCWYCSRNKCFKQHLWTCEYHTHRYNDSGVRSGTPLSLLPNFAMAPQPPSPKLQQKSPSHDGWNRSEGISHNPMSNKTSMSKQINYTSGYPLSKHMELSCNRQTFQPKFTILTKLLKIRSCDAHMFIFLDADTITVQAIWIYCTIVLQYEYTRDLSPINPLCRLERSPRMK
jgi:hypothetical protein